MRTHAGAMESDAPPVILRRLDRPRIPRDDEPAGSWIGIRGLAAEMSGLDDGAVAVGLLTRD